MHLFVDDQREPPPGPWLLARTNAAAIAQLEAHRVEHLSLDYCLAKGQTTDEIMYWLREHPERWPTGAILCHSSSTDACSLIERMARSYAPTAG